MKPAQEWQQPFVVTAGIEELSHNPAPFCPTDNHDDVRFLVCGTTALADNVR